MRVKSEQLRLYAVTDRAWTTGAAGLLRQAEDAIDGGATMLQLREKHLCEEAFLAEARDFVALCRRRGVISIINDNVEIAVKSGADGVHVGQEDLEAGRVRALLGSDKIIGVSAHNVDEALRAQAAGADYLGIGAAFVTGTKADASPITHATIRAITQAVDLPAVAIGGITADNILSLRGCGLSGVAVVSALFAQSDVRLAAAEMRRLACEISRY
jgi:thiamine-phosphate pyrophosphorylase